MTYQTDNDIVTYIMTKRDTEKDIERPHYYSQFWLDVAAGRRIIGTPKPNEEGEQAEAELLEPASPLTEAYSNSTQQSDTLSHAASNGKTEKAALPEAVSEIAVSSDEEFTEPEADLDLIFADLAATDEPDALIEDADIPDMDFSIIDEEEEEEEEEFDEEEPGEKDALASEDVEEDEMDWGRGRKKPKPLRQVKPPAKKPVKRDPRRGSY